MEIRADEISQIIRKRIDDFDREVEIAETGTVLSVGDGVARIYGLENALAGEMVEFPNKVMGVVLNLDADNVGVAIFGEVDTVREGDTVKRSGQILSVPVGEGMVGRVVNALGQPIDGLGAIKSTETRPVEVKAPGIRARQQLPLIPSSTKKAWMFFVSTWLSDRRILRWLRWWKSFVLTERWITRLSYQQLPANRRHFNTLLPMPV